MKDVFDTYAESVKILLQYLPDIHKAAAIKEPLDKMQGWSAFLGRPRAFVNSGGRPLIVGTLFGPTGSGKSALFRNLTGIQVPSDLVRPTSYSCVVAAPERIVDQDTIQRLFPNSRVSLMEHPDVLRDPSRRDELFCAFYPPTQANGSVVNLILADVPDFNSVDQENWARAEQMLSRAEVVVFMTYAEAYKNERVISYLVKACQNAGHLIYVLNKTSQADAVTIWDDLLKYASEVGRFSEKRHSDGLQLHEFLANAASYYLPHGGEKVPSLDQMKPIREMSPEFSSFLTGLDAARVILKSLMEVTPGGVATSRRVLAKAEEERDRLTNIIEVISNEIVDQAKFVAETQFPIGRWMELVIEISKKERPPILKFFGVFSGGIYAFAGGAIKKIRDFFNKNKSDLRSREEVEKERLRLVTQALVDTWRKAYPEWIVRGGFLSGENRIEMRDAFLKKPLPPVGTQWDDFVRAKVLNWTREHPILCGAVATLSDLLTIGGITVLAVDLLAGGLTTMAAISTHGLLAAGIGTGAIGVFVNIMEKLHLDRTLQDAYLEWGKIRTREISGHIQHQFAAPLFVDSVKEHLDALQSAPIEECMAACAALEQIEQNTSTRV